VSGKLEVKIPLCDANLSTGRWRFCLSSVVVIQSEESLTRAVTVAISTNQALLETRTGKRYVQTYGPARIVLSVLNGCEAKCPVRLEFAGHWAEMQNTANSFYLILQDSTDDSPIEAELQALLLIERLA
jgi:hypothetical protein